MPALDDLLGSGATHIADQNKHKPVKTLCGQALDKDSTRYFANRDNFEQVTCKICSGIYFDVDWRGEQRESVQDTPTEPEPPQNPETLNKPTARLDTSSNSELLQNQAPTRRLFANLEIPINDHSKKDDLGNGEQDGDQNDGS